MCHYITRVHPCGYESPILLHHSCDSDWKAPDAHPRRPPCPLEESTVERIKVEHREGWHLKDKCCETCDRDECKVWRLGNWETGAEGRTKRRGGVYRSFQDALLAYQEAKAIVLGTGGK